MKFLAHLLPLALLLSVTTATEVMDLEDDFEISELLDMVNDMKSSEGQQLLDLDEDLATQLVQCSINPNVVRQHTLYMTNRAMWIKNYMMGQITSYTNHFIYKDNDFYNNVVRRTPNANLRNMAKSNQLMTKRLALQYYLYSYKTSEMHYEQMVEYSFHLQHILRKALHFSCVRAQSVVAQYAELLHSRVDYFSYYQIKMLQRYNTELVAQRSMNIAVSMDNYSKRTPQHVAIKEYVYTYADYMMKKSREFNQNMRAQYLGYINYQEAHINPLRVYGGIQ